MYYSSIDSKAIDVIADYIESNRGPMTSGVEVIRGFQGIDLPCPRIEIMVDQSSMEVIGECKTGNWFLTCSVSFVVGYDERGTDNRNVWTPSYRADAESELFDAILQDDLPSKLNAHVNGREIYFFGGVEGEGAGLDEPITIRPMLGMDGEMKKELSFILYCKASA